MHTKRKHFLCTPVWDECTETPLLLFLSPGVNALGYCWFGQRDLTIYFLTGKKKGRKSWTLIWIQKRTAPAGHGCCASRWEENGSYGGRWSWSDITPTNLGNRVQKFLIFVELGFFFGFFLIPCSWIDTAVTWSSSWASLTYQALWETAQGEGGRGNAHSMVPGVHCRAQAGVRCPGQFSACPALLGLTAGEKQLSRLGKPRKRTLRNRSICNGLKTMSDRDFWIFPFIKIKIFVVYYSQCCSHHSRYLGPGSTSSLLLFNLLK